MALYHDVCILIRPNLVSTRITMTSINCMQVLWSWQGNYFIKVIIGISWHQSLHQHHQWIQHNQWSSKAPRPSKKKKKITLMKTWQTGILVTPKRKKKSREKFHPIVKTILMAHWISTMMKTWKTDIMCNKLSMWTITLGGKLSHLPYPSYDISIYPSKPYHSCPFSHLLWSW